MTSFSATVLQHGMHDVTRYHLGEVSFELLAQTDLLYFLSLHKCFMIIIRRRRGRIETVKRRKMIKGRSTCQLCKKLDPVNKTREMCVMCESQRTLKFKLLNQSKNRRR